MGSTNPDASWQARPGRTPAVLARQEHMCTPVSSLVPAKDLTHDRPLSLSEKC